MHKDPRIYLEHILESIEAIDSYIIDFNKEKFLKSGKTQDAVIRRLEIIGEAVKNLPLKFRNDYKNVSWKSAAGMRDKMIHEYFLIDEHIVWKTIKSDLPEFKKRIKNILEGFKQDKIKL